ncbi:hypothetical protein ACU8NU_00470 [Rhizobium leguminosarum]
MTKMFALLDFTYPFDAFHAEQSGTDFDAPKTSIAHGTEFEADAALEAECIVRGYAVRADSADAQFVRAACGSKT